MSGKAICMQGGEWEWYAFFFGSHQFHFPSFPRAMGLTLGLFLEISVFCIHREV